MMYFLNYSAIALAAFEFTTPLFTYFNSSWTWGTEEETKEADKFER